jgi:hypothetical protein
MIHGVPYEVCSLTGICEETWWVQNSCKSNLATGRQRIHVVSWKWSLNSRSFLGINYCIEMRILIDQGCKERLQDTSLKQCVEQVPHR